MRYSNSKNYLLVLVVLPCLALSGTAKAQTINDLFNTGVSGSGALLAANGAADTHWTNGASGTAFTTSNGNYHTYPDANYITVDQSGGNGSYTVTFNTTFTLPSNVILSTVSIAGNYSIDDSLSDILINGHSTGIANSAGGNFTIANPVNLPTSFYQVGANTLGIVWQDQSGPGAIAFEFTSKSFRTSAVPEPGSLAILAGMGLSSAGILARRKYVRKAV